jgi:hypothetical protein
MHKSANPPFLGPPGVGDWPSLPFPPPTEARVDGVEWGGELQPTNSDPGHLDHKRKVFLEHILAKTRIRTDLEKGSADVAYALIYTAQHEK